MLVVEFELNVRYDDVDDDDVSQASGGPPLTGTTRWKRSSIDLQPTGHVT